MKSQRFFSWLLRVLLVGAALACHAAEEPDRTIVAGREEEPDPASAMLEVVNAGRTRPLRFAEAVQEVTQVYVSELSRQGVLPSGDISQQLIGRLNSRGYHAYRVVVGFAQMGGTFSEVLAVWRQGDPGTFERLANSELQDFALGVGYHRGQPFYLAVGAVRQQSHYEAESADMRRDLEKVRQGVLRQVNQVRQEAGAAPLRRHPALDLAAQSYARAMLDRGFYGHYSPEGQDVVDRVKQVRYDYHKVGENVASGQPNIDAVMQGWVDSPEHYRNLVDREFTEIGIGFAAGPTADGSYRFLWVQVFADPRN